MTIFFENYNLRILFMKKNSSNKLLVNQKPFGNSEVMDFYSTLFLNFKQYTKKRIEIPDLDLIYYHFENQEYKIIEKNIKHKLLLSLCNIIAIFQKKMKIGKTTLMNELNLFLIIIF